MDEYLRAGLIELERKRGERTQAHIAAGFCAARVRASTIAKNHPPLCSRRAVRDGLCGIHLKTAAHDK